MALPVTHRTSALMRSPTIAAVKAGNQPTLATSSTTGTPLVKSKSAPTARCHRVAANHPAPASNKVPVVGGSSEQRAVTKGATKRGLNASFAVASRAVAVRFVPAVGPIVLTMMLYLAPSRAMLLLNPTIAHFYGGRRTVSAKATISPLDPLTAAA